MKRNIVVSTLFIVLSISIAVSCMRGGQTKAGELNINLSAEPKTIDPTFSSSTEDFAYIRHTFEGLTAKDKEHRIVPGVAERWDISSDGLVYTFHLRKNSFWSDGKQVVAKDFIYAWQRIVDPKSAAEYSFFLEDIKNAKEITAGKMPVSSLAVKAIDDYTLEVTLRSPTAYFLELLAFPVFYPLRKDIVEKSPDAWTLDPKTFIGNGPFIMTEREINSKIVVVKNTNYWNKDTIVPEKINFILLDDGNAAVAGVKTGTLDFSVHFPNQDVPLLLKEGYARTYPYLGTYYFIVNHTNKVLKDKRVREALTLAIDRMYIVDNILKAGQKSANAWVPPGIPDINGDFYDNGKDRPYIDNGKNYAENTAKAKQLLAEAGYPDGNGFPILRIKGSNGDAHKMIIEVMQQMYKEVLNIDVTVEVMEWAIWQQNRKDKTFDLGRGSWIGDYLDPMTFLDVFLSYNNQNHGMWTNKEFDALIQSAKNSVDMEERMTSMHKAEKILLDDYALIPIYFYTTTVIANPKLKDASFNPLGEWKFLWASLEK